MLAGDETVRRRRGIERTWHCGDERGVSEGTEGAGQRQTFSWPGMRLHLTLRDLEGGG